MKMRLKLLVLLMGFILSSCVRESPATQPIVDTEAIGQDITQIQYSTPDIQYEEMISKSAISGEGDCLPPCWKGITPGITDVDEAISIMQELGFVDDSGVFSVDEENKMLHWFSGDAEWVTLIFDEDVVEFIDFRFLDIKLGEILEYFQSPEGYFELKDDFGIGYEIFFPTKGAIILAVCPTSLSLDCDVVGGFFVPISNLDGMVFQYHEIRQNLHGSDTTMYSFTEWEGVEE